MLSNLATAIQHNWPIWLVTVVLIVAAVIDGIQLKVPNWITFPMIITGWAFSYFNPDCPGLEGLGWSLLGTVVGMIEAFHVIAFTGGMGDASLLAGGISKALVNTAAGLSVALPALALHHFFRHRLTAGGLALEEQLERLLDACVRRGDA